MKTKKIIAIIIMSILVAPTIVGCNQPGSTTPTTQTEALTDSVTEETKDNNLFEFSTKEIGSIKEVLENYGVKVGLGTEEKSDSEVTISEVVEDANEGVFSYSIFTNDFIYRTDIATGDYRIFYDSYAKGDKSRYEYQIYMNFSDEEEFKIDNFSMFKDLVKAHFGDDYDMASLESFIQDHLKERELDGLAGSNSRTTGLYYESVSGGNVVGDIVPHRNALAYKLTPIE